MNRISEKRLKKLGGKMPFSSIQPKPAAKPKRKAGAMGAMMQRKSKIKPRNAKRRESEFARCYHSRARVRFIKSLPCVVCSSLSVFFAAGTAGACDNAHTVTDGMGRKAGYETIVPMCRGHHRAYDEYRGELGRADVRAAIVACAERVSRNWLGYTQQEKT